MIAFLGAMDIEVDGIKKMMTDTETTQFGPYTYFKGKLHGKEIVVAKCGIGKVSSGSCTTALIQLFSPSLIVNTGVAGGLLKGIGMKKGDIVIADKTVHHDADATALGYALGQVPDQPLYFECDPKAAERLIHTAKETLNVQVFSGTIASGDAFVSSEELSAKIRDTFGAAACEMEGASIGQVCTACSVPYCVIRAISDCADDDASMDYPTFEKLAAARAIELVSTFVKTY
ncbi:MAG: 5'-methylthioadenosine/adenosylhomocysteine nucleosidase [Christensenellaceae bacterium]|nr:5'-methylthioadenosine/adenosylhomocysteine nucleosidase [Christensenellaceae bacterium]